VSVGGDDGRHRVEIVPLGASVNVARRAPGEAPDRRPAHHDVLAHARERLHQVNGRLEPVPDPRRAERIVITSTTEN
jgi:hypothetical protein